jgi:hypothetical protein
MEVPKCRSRIQGKGLVDDIRHKTPESKMKIPVQKLYLTRRVEIGVVALFAAAAFLAEFAAAQSPVTNR